MTPTDIVERRCFQAGSQANHSYASDAPGGVVVALWLRVDVQKEPS